MPFAGHSHHTEHAVTQEQARLQHKGRASVPGLGVSSSMRGASGGGAPNSFKYAAVHSSSDTKLSAQATPSHRLYLPCLQRALK